MDRAAWSGAGARTMNKESRLADTGKVEHRRTILEHAKQREKKNKTKKRQGAETRIWPTTVSAAVDE